MEVKDDGSEHFVFVGENVATVVFLGRVIGSLEWLLMVTEATNIDGVNSLRVIMVDLSWTWNVGNSPLAIMMSWRK